MKTYNFNVDADFLSKSTSIRQKIDIILELIHTIKFITAFPLSDILQKKHNVYGLVIYVDKMSRVFYYSENKVTTFQFPFSIVEENDRINVRYNQFELDSKTTSILLSVFTAYDHIRISRESAFDTYDEVMKDFEISDNGYRTLCWGLVEFLLSFEAGYLRYDIDEKREDPTHHPLNHLDVYYSNKCTFKLGLPKRINHPDLINILNINTDCAYLKL